MTIPIVAMTLVVQAQTTVAKKVDPPAYLKRYILLFGYKGATVVPGAYSETGDSTKGVFVILKTPYDASTVATHYEKQVFFPAYDLFDSYLHDHPVMGTFRYPKDAFTIFYHRDKIIGLFMYRLRNESGGTDCVTIARTGEQTTIIVQTTRPGKP